MSQTKREEYREKLREKLRDLFQFDVADLNFGIYRILNAKRDRIEKFIDEDLIAAVREALENYASDASSNLNDELETAESKIAAVESRISEIFDSPEELLEFKPNSELALEFQEARARVDDAQESMERAKASAELEAEIYNDLYHFFTRYYDDGDFHTERRYSSREHKYMVPHDGEEVFLHWANKDQYYIKTGERFRNYRFDIDVDGDRDFQVWFKVEEADVPTDNNKGEDRYFVLREHQPVRYDAEQRMLTAHFVRKPLDEDEEQALIDVYNEVSDDKERDQLRYISIPVVIAAIIEKAVDDKRVLGRLREPHRNSSAGNSVLLHHLNQFTAKNERDYFIHKDLGGFLRRELDFYLKNEVVDVDSFIADPSGAAYERAVLRARAVHDIADKIIDFLAQIEDFQKRLFKKKKFVTETNWCVTLDHVPKKLYSDILANDEQLEAWFDLYAIDQWEDGPESPGDIDEAFLKAHQSMMVDTGLFRKPFKDELMMCMEDVENLEAKTKGLLIHGDNWQVIRSIESLYEREVKHLFIDPPYNTELDRKQGNFLYKDDYPHSSWLSMMFDRLKISKELLAHNGTHAMSIDDNEFSRLKLIADNIFGSQNFISTICWKSRDSVSSDQKVSMNHNYLLLHGKSAANEFSGLPLDPDDYENPDDDPRGPWTLVPLDANKPGGDTFYPITNPNTGEDYFPPNGRSWAINPESFNQLMEDGRIKFGKSGKAAPKKKLYLQERLEKGDVKTPISVWGETETTQNGTEQVMALFGDKVFDYPKPVGLLSRLLTVSSAKHDALVLDYFAGSGTTGHAVIDLNREDGGDRKYILVEMGEYFDTVLKPRIQKVVFAEEWKDGVPQFEKDGKTGGVERHIFKYQRIESYEDALANIPDEPGDNEQQQKLWELGAERIDDYVPKYMLDFEARGSQTLVNTQAFDDPFKYKLKVHRGGTSPEPVCVDLQETFHYLIGMKVRRMEVYERDGRIYRVSRGEVEHRTGSDEVVVIWRQHKNEAGESLYETPKGEDNRLMAEKKWFQDELLTGDEDIIYINGGAPMPKARALEVEFRENMEA